MVWTRLLPRTNRLAKSDNIRCADVGTHRTSPVTAAGAGNGGEGAAPGRACVPLDVEQARDDQQKIAQHGLAVGCDLVGKTKFAGGGGPPGEIAAALVEPQTLRQLAIDEAPRVGRRR